MPVLKKSKHLALKAELGNRFSGLCDAFESRDLKNKAEGVRGEGRWVSPASHCGTKADDYALRLAVDDFKNILTEIRKLK